MVDKEMGTVLSDNLQGGLAAIALDGHLALSTAYMLSMHVALMLWLVVPWQ